MSDEELNLDELSGPDDGADEQLPAEEGKALETPESIEPAAEKPDEQPESGKENTVPLATLLEERRRARDELAAARVERERVEKIEKELKAFREKQAPAPEVKPDEAPDYVADPKGYLEWRAKQAEQQVNKELEPIRQDWQQRQHAQQQEQIVQQIVTKAGEYESSFIREVPDYHDALQHIRGLRMAEANALGIPSHIAQQNLRNQEIQLAAYALQNGKDPAQLAYTLAQSLGYNPQSTKAAPAQETDEQIAARNAGKEKAQSMGGSGGASAEDLLGASNEEFEEAMAEMFGKRR